MPSLSFIDSCAISSKCNARDLMSNPVFENCFFPPVTFLKRNKVQSNLIFGNTSMNKRKRRVFSVRAAADKLGFLGKLGRVIKEKAQSDFDRVFKGVSKTRDNLAVIDELLAYWNLNEADRILEELEEALIVADFGPRTSIKIVDAIRNDVKAGKFKSGPEIKEALKIEIMKLLTKNVPSSDLNISSSIPTVIMIIGVNGGGKTTTIGKLAHRFKEGGSKVLMAAGDTFRAAAGEQLSVWAERTDAQIVFPLTENTRPSSVLSAAVRKAVEEKYDIVLADTSGRLHTNYSLMEELRNCKKSISKTLPNSPHEVLLVLDGTTGLNMLAQAKEFNQNKIVVVLRLHMPMMMMMYILFKQYMGVTGFVLTKLDGTSKGGCVASVVDELKIPIKFIGVGEGLEDLQPFDAQAFVAAVFP